MLKFKLYVLSLFFLFCLPLLGTDSIQSQFSDVEDQLINKGFENVMIIETDHELRVYYENITFRDDFAATVHVIDELLQIDDIRLQNIQRLQLIPLTTRRALYSFQFDIKNLIQLGKGNIEPRRFFENCKVQESVKKDLAFSPKNSSLWKLDFLFSPQIAANIGNYDDRLKMQVNLLPALRFVPWSGGSIFTQYKIPLVNEFVWETSQLGFKQVFLQQLYQLPAGFNGLSHIGLLGHERWGISTEIGRYFFNRMFLFGAKYHLTGAFYKRRQEWFYSQMNSSSYQIYLDWNEPRLNVLVGLSYNKFLMLDTGWQMDISRFYNEVKIGTYFGITDIDKFFGVKIRIPLNSKQTAPRKYVRMTVPDYYTWGYQASSQVYTYAAPIQSGIVLGAQHSLRQRFYDTLPGYMINNLNRVFRSR